MYQVLCTETMHMQQSPDNNPIVTFILHMGKPTQKNIKWLTHNPTDRCVVEPRAQIEEFGA